MKYFFLLVSLISSAIFISSFKEIELFSIESMFTWRFSHLLPYILTFLSGIALAVSFYSLKLLKNKALRLITVLLFAVAPFVLSFIMHPIYEGDFSSEGDEISTVNSITGLKKFNLAVLTIPGCPYCMGSISRLKLLKERNPDMQIDFIVTNYGDSTDKYIVSMYNDYKKEINGAFALRFDDSTLNVSAMTTRFPTFIYLDKGRPVYKWTNDQFGAGAMDHLEESFRKNK